MADPVGVVVDLVHSVALIGLALAVWNNTRSVDVVLRRLLPRDEGGE